MTLDCIFCTLTWLWSDLRFGSLGEWGAVFAELVVAWVIYRELQENRNAAFLQKATLFETNRDRSAIYKAYFALPMTSNTVEEASRSFYENAFNQGTVQEACHRQLALFNELGLVYRKHFWFFRNRLVTVLPHAAIYMWIFYGRHVKERRNDSGFWFATPMLKFTLESVKFALKFNQDLCLRPESGQPGKKELKVTVQDLKTIRADLEAELKRTA
jgi:hypothetical protein